MNVCYVDPSAWIKRHFQERGSESVNALFSSGIHAACCNIGLLEMIATVARKGHAESLSDEVLNVLIEHIRDDFSLFVQVALDSALIDAATVLARRHRLRTVDAIHLASALSLVPANSVSIVSADAELLSAARAENIPTINPAS
jgi:uncharacterized protein